MAIAVIAGILVGAMSALLLYAGLRYTKRLDAQSSAVGYLTPALASVGGSFIVLAFATLLCVIVARPYVGPFVIAEACTLVVAALGYGVTLVIRK